MWIRVHKSGSIKAQKDSENVHLTYDNWNDFQYVTMFDLSVYDDIGVCHDVGKVKIGFVGQTKQDATIAKLPVRFQSLESNFFSLGQGSDYYRKLAAIPGGYGKKVLAALRDIAADPEAMDLAKDEGVFKTSLLRDISLSVVKGQFARLLNGQAELTDFNFMFQRAETNDLGEISVGFNVKAESTPSTNVHAVIGRNGVGKTTLLNGMIEAIMYRNGIARFFDLSSWKRGEIAVDYFSSLVSVSFSAFDSFSPPKEQSDPSKGTCYWYIGLKDPEDAGRHRTISDLRVDCVKSLAACFRNSEKTARWRSAIQRLGSDENFERMRLVQLANVFAEIHDNNPQIGQSDSDAFLQHYLQLALPYLTKMSSGHAIVLLTVTRLVEAVQEKTLVLLDEPESHLHPPLLSAFIRALTDLLYEQNGVAIVATHSPVVLQEIPRSCVWKIYRTGRAVTIANPNIETFGENVGRLTSEVFGLEVERSGFHSVLSKDVASGKTYSQVLEKYDDQLGIEGRSILSSLIADRKREGQA